MASDTQPEAKQRTAEWETLDAEAIRYHTVQWDTPKRSTVAFERFVADELARSSSVIDMGAGAGAATAYLAQRHPGVRFTAFEYSAELAAIGSRVARDKQVGNIEFRQGDWFDLAPTAGFDGAVSLQTLSWLPEYERPLAEIFAKLAPRWLAVTSLFYEGDITCRIEVEEHKRSRKSFYNTYSLPALSRFCEAHGYALTRRERFEIDVDLDRPADADLMGTYTRRAAAENEAGFERLQVSGPLLMNWYQLLIEKRG